MLAIEIPESKVTPQRCLPVKPDSFKEQSQGNLFEEGCQRESIAISYLCISFSPTGSVD